MPELFLRAATAVSMEELFAMSSSILQRRFLVFWKHCDYELVDSSWKHKPCFSAALYNEIIYLENVAL